MSAECPNGHLSQTSDYCDQCGAAIQAATAVPAPPASAEPDELEVPPDTRPSVPAEPCPNCRTPRVGSDKFCEGCGYDFATGTPAAPPAAPAVQRETAEWEAVVEADRDYFERVGALELAFPEHCPARLFVLQEPRIGIGRHSATRGTRPEIDLSGAPEDPAISHLHAMLLRQEDGSYVVMDMGSSNGTTVNEGAPIPPNAPVALSDGDRVHLGAWTRMTIRCSQL